MPQPNLRIGRAEYGGLGQALPVFPWAAWVQVKPVLKRVRGRDSPVFSASFSAVARYANDAAGGKLRQFESCARIVDTIAS